MLIEISNNLFSKVKKAIVHIHKEEYDFWESFGVYHSDKYLNILQTSSDPEKIKKAEFAYQLYEDIPFNIVWYREDSSTYFHIPLVQLSMFMESLVQWEQTLTQELLFRKRTLKTMKVSKDERGEIENELVSIIMHIEKIPIYLNQLEEFQSRIKETIQELA